MPLQQQSRGQQVGQYAAPSNVPAIEGGKSPHPETTAPATRRIGHRGCLGLPELGTDGRLLPGHASLTACLTWGFPLLGQM